MGEREGENGRERENMRERERMGEREGGRERENGRERGREQNGATFLAVVRRTSSTDKTSVYQIRAVGMT